MFESIRKHQRLLQFVLLLMIMPAFVFFGVSGYSGFMSGDDRVATVGGEKISRQEFDQAQRQQLENLRQMLGGQVDARMLDTDAARNEVLDGLIAQKAIMLEASRLRISVPDDKLREAIASIPGLKKPDGSFDMERYRALLSAQNMTEPMFESQMRRELALQALPEAVAQSSVVPTTVLERLLVLQEQGREVRELSFKPEQFADKVTPDAAALKKFYEDNPKLFEAPERAKVEYLVLDAQASASQIPVDATKVKDFYEQNKARYTVAEQRRASHILITVAADADEKTRDAAKAKAQALLKQLRDGADFATLAKAQSQDPGSASAGGDLGFFPRESMVKPFADAAWALEDGQLSDVVKSDFGYHLIKLTGIKPAQVKPFESVKGEIEQEFRNQEGAREFAKNAETFTNMVYEQSDSLKPTAEHFKLTIKTADDLGRQGVGGPDAQKSPLGNARLLAALFSEDSIRTHRNTEAIEIAPSMLVSARIVDYHAAERKPFDSVQADVRKRLVAQESSRLAREAGAARLKALQAGEAASGFGDARVVHRSGAGALAPQASEAVFRADAAKLPAYVGVELGNTYEIFQVSKIVEPTAAELNDKRAAFGRQVTQSLAQQELGDFLGSVKNRTGVKKNLAAIAIKSEPR